MHFPDHTQGNLVTELQHYKVTSSQDSVVPFFKINSTVCFIYYNKTEY